MSFQSFMEAVLPPVNGVKPHISGSVFTSPRANRPRTNNTHGAIDFNYIGGQPFNRSRNFPAYAPVSGNVEVAGGSYGSVFIRDSEGYLHGILHLTHIQAKAGTSVSAGSRIGIMGGKGPSGATQYDIHIHYQLENPSGKLIDPVAFHDGNGQVFTAPLSEEDVDVHAEDPNHYHYEPDEPVGFVSEFEPRQAATSTASDVQGALWTNRVPRHEPWPRTLMGDTPEANVPSEEHEQNVNHNPQFTPDNLNGAKSIGRIEGEDVIERGPFWRR